MHVKASDPNAYYSCDDNLPLVEKAVTSDQGVGHRQGQSLNYSVENVSREATSNSEGKYYY